MIAESEYDKYRSPQYEYLPFGFGEFDTDPELEIKERIRTLDEKRYTMQKIANMVGRSKSYVENTLKERRTRVNERS